MPRQRTTRGNDGRWEYAYGLLESQRINCKGAKAPEVGEVVLVVGNGKNRGEWKKWKVLRQARGREGAVRGVVLLHKWQTTQRQILSVRPLEVRCTTKEQQRRASQTSPSKKKDSEGKQRFGE